MNNWKSSRPIELIFMTFSMVAISLVTLILEPNVNAAKVSKIKSSCKERLITIPDNYDNFEAEVIEWIGNCVKSNSKKNGKPVRRELKLVKGNKTLKKTWDNVKNMHGVEVGIVAKYIGKYKVKKIKFSPLGFDSEPIVFEKESVTAKSPITKRWKVRKKDIKKGKPLLKNILKISKSKAKKIASMPENPVGTPGATEVIKILKDASPKSLAKYTVGGLIDVLTANQSGKVSKARRELYDSYSDGVVKILDPDYKVYIKNMSPLEKEFYRLGKSNAKKLSPVQRHQLRMFLIESDRTYSLKGFAPLEPTRGYFESKYHGSLYHKSMMNEVSKSEYLYR